MGEDGWVMVTVTVAVSMVDGDRGGRRLAAGRAFPPKILLPAKNTGKDLISRQKEWESPSSRQKQLIKIWREIRFWIFCWG